MLNILQKMLGNFVILTDKIFYIGKNFAISVEWVSALGTVLAVMVALGLSVTAWYRDSRKSSKLNKLLIRFYCYELNSSNNKIIDVLIWSKAVHENHQNGVVAREFLEKLVESLGAVVQYYQLEKINNNIEKFFQIPDGSICHNIITQMKVMEQEAFSFLASKKELEKTLIDEGNRLIEVDVKK